jgi:hypothetical protein
METDMQEDHVGTIHVFLYGTKYNILIAGNKHSCA